jgi:DNA-binding XRE family transcriptional regulator
LFVDVRLVPKGAVMIDSLVRAEGGTRFLWAPKPPPYRPGPAARQVSVAVGKRLRQARQMAGVTRPALAAAIGVAAATVGRYEAGRRLPPARLAAAALFLGFPLSWFFREEEAPDAAPSRED